MSGDLRMFNRQRTRLLDLKLFRQVTEASLNDLLNVREFDLTIHLVGDSAMARLNQKHLNHEGTTDVITLDYAGPGAPALAGELFICVDEALRQAREFHAPWTTELTRYAIHGILHLRGHDDLNAAARRWMKTTENRLLREVSRRFDLSKLARKRRLTA